MRSLCVCLLRGRKPAPRQTKISWLALLGPRPLANFFFFFPLLFFSAHSLHLSVDRLPVCMCTVRAACQRGCEWYSSEWHTIQPSCPGQKKTIQLDQVALAKHASMKQSILVRGRVDF